MKKISTNFLFGSKQNQTLTKKLKLLFFSSLSALGFAQVSTSFASTGAVQTFTVPTGITEVTVKLWGAGGAGGHDNAGYGGSGGSGSFLKGTLSVTPGQVLYIVAGGRGTFATTTGTHAGGYGGGGTAGRRAGSGGGYSGIFTTSTLSQANALVVAGGGAGGGTWDFNTYGGGGGATSGSAGGTVPTTLLYTGGGGGTTSAGGAGGGGTMATVVVGQAGSALQGGNGTDATYGAGGGGGGYFGGGAGSRGGSTGNNGYSSGGGGGSSYFSSTYTSSVATAGTISTASSAATQAPGNAEAEYVTGVGNGGQGATNTATLANGGNGLVVISYTPPSEVAPDCTTITSPAAGSTTVSPNLSLSWTPITIASGYKVYIGTTSGGTDIVNGTTTTSATYSINLSPLTTYYAKVVPYNAKGDATGCSEISFKTTYCSGAGIVDTNTGLAITNVSFANLTNPSARAAYSNFTTSATTANVEKETSYTVSITNGQDGNPYIMYTDDVAYVWIDYNQDGIFSDSERTEVVVGNNNTVTSTASIAIPATALIGETTMRIRYSNSAGANYNSACGTGFGEVEDYKVKIFAQGTLGLSDISKAKISVYPNPFTDVLKISDVTGVKSVSVSDISGREVKTISPSAELNLSSLKAGLYIVNLKMEDGSVKTFKAIKK